MDHFTLPKGKAHLRVPNLTTQAYTRGDGDFEGYPSRMKWKPEEVDGQDSFGGRSPEEVQAFFQSWLFFGCVIEVLAVAHVRVEQADFLDGQYVSTSQLPHFIRKWKRKVDAVGDKATKTNIRHAMKIATILKRVSDFVDRYCLPFPSRSVRSQANGRSPVSDLTWTSIIALGHTLTQAMISFYDIRRTGNRWGASPLLKRRLLSKGWCPMDVERSMSDMGIDGQYYLANLARTETNISHESCTKHECTARNVNRDTYKQRHVREKGDCGGAVKVKVDEVVKIIHTPGCVPVFRWDPHRKQLDIASSQMLNRGVSSPPYITISHVWSDGLGNLKDNALLECQLDRIQRLVDAVATSPAVKGTPQYFWLDTLCIPVGDEMRPVRRMAIGDMANIYKAAAATLVLSSTIEAVATTDSPRDWCLALYMANWNRRLWTCQEGMLAQVIMLQFADQAVSNDILDDEGVEKSIANGHCVTFPKQARIAAMGEFVILRDFLRGNLFAEMGNVSARSGPLPIAISVLQTRSTSWRSDETICLGTMMGLNLKPLQDLEAKMREEENIPDNEPIDDRRLAERRMEQFLRMVKAFPRDVIFNTSQRLAIEGFRWAPVSFLGTARYGFVRTVEGGYGIFDQKGRGLRVYAHGLLVTTDYRIPADSSAPMLIEATAANGQSVTLKVAVSQPEVAYPPQFAWRPDCQYGIILDKSVVTVAHDSLSRKEPSKRPRNGPDLELWFERLYDRSNGSDALVDAVIGYVRRDFGTGIQVEHACLASISLVDPMPVFDGESSVDLDAFDGPDLKYDGYESDSADSAYLELRGQGDKSDFAIGNFGSEPDNDASRYKIPRLPTTAESDHDQSSSGAVEVDKLSDWGSVLEDGDHREAEHAPEEMDDEVGITAVGKYIKNGRWFIV